MPRLLEMAFLYFLYIVFLQAVAADEECSFASPEPLYLRFGNCSLPTFANYPYFALEVDIASEPLCLVPSCTVNGTFVISTQICTNNHNSTYGQSVSTRAGLFIQSGTASFNESLQALTANPVWDSLNPQITDAGYTTIQFSSGLALLGLPYRGCFGRTEC